MDWTRTTVGDEETAWTLTDDQGRQYVLIYDSASDLSNPGWIIQTVEIDEDGVTVVTDCGILDENDPDNVEAAQIEAEQYLGLGTPQ